MPVCKRKRVTRYQYCSGDLDKYVLIQERRDLPPAWGELEPVVQFTELKNVWAALENTSAAIKGIAEFSDVNIEDVPTHVLSVRYDPDLSEIESGNHFALWEGRRFRILNRKDVNEIKTILEFNVRETGDSDALAASK